MIEITDWLQLLLVGASPPIDLFTEISSISQLLLSVFLTVYTNPSRASMK